MRSVRDEIGDVMDDAGTSLHSGVELAYNACLPH